MCFHTGNALLWGRLLRLPDLDTHLATVIDTNRSAGATELAVHLLRSAAQNSDSPISGADLPATAEVAGLESL